MQRQIIPILIALVMTVPVGAATWFAYGSYEPDTLKDQNGGLMWPDPNVGTAEKVYFNAYQTEAFAGTSINTGTTGSRIQMAGEQNWNAVLGVWKDCNNDGFVGLEESAVVVYPAAALTDSSICPKGSLHNDGQWVWEYIPVGHQFGESPQDAQNVQIDDQDARIWADIGLPGATAAGTCPISPFPHGTTAGTGWMIRYIDCFAGNRIQSTANGLGAPFAFTCPPTVTDCAGNPQKSDSILNQQLPQSLFGNPETGETGTLQLDSNEDGGSREYAFTTWDCSGRAVDVKNPTGIHSYSDVDAATGGALGPIPSAVDSDGNENFDDQGSLVWAANPNPQVIDPTASVADGLNETFMGFHAGGGDADRDTTYVGGDCNFDSDNSAGDNTYSGLHQTVFFRADGPFEPPAQAGKKQTDDYFIYFNGAKDPNSLNSVTGDGTPNDIVSTPTTDYDVGNAIWQSNTLWTTTPQFINRNTLQIVSSTYWSFYAKVGTATTSQGFAVPGDAVYGSEACGSFVSGVHNGWDCQQDHWYTDANFQPIVDGNEVWQGKVGYHYQLRDIDCLDGTVARGSGVHASGSDVATDGGSPCQDATV